MSKVDDLLAAAQAWANSIAFYDPERGYVCYSVTHTLDLQEKLRAAAFAYGRKSND